MLKTEFGHQARVTTCVLPVVEEVSVPPSLRERLDQDQLAQLMEVEDVSVIVTS